VIKNTFPGKFIAIEGLDGSGKATQAAAIAEALRLTEKKVLLACEPTGSLVGDLIRQRLAGNWQSSPECLQLLFAADRADHLQKEIIPNLAAGGYVVCDRYAFSSFAYGALDCDLDWLIDVNKTFILPDLVLFVDVPPDVCMQRLAVEGKDGDIFEKLTLLNKVVFNYQTIFKKFVAQGVNIAIVDGNKNSEDVFSEIKKIIEKII